MIISDKEQKIKEKVQEITGINIKINQQASYDFVKHFRVYKIKKILLVCSSYNYFQLDEEGRLNTLFSKYRSFDDLGSHPQIIHVDNGKQCLDKLKNEHFDLILIFNQPDDIDIANLSKKIKEITTMPIVLLSNDVNELTKIIGKNKHNIFKGFTWNGDGKIILSIVQYCEDIKNLQNSSSADIKRCILLIEDSIQYYSDYLSLINEEINSYLTQIINENLTTEQKILRSKRKPFILHVDDYEKAIVLYEQYKDDLICIITDNYIEKDGFKKEIGLEIAKTASKNDPNLPILIQSSEPFKEDEVKNQNITFISKSSGRHRNVLKKFINKSLGPYKVILKDNEGKDVLQIKDINDFENALKTIESDLLIKYIKKNSFSNWLKNIGEVELSNKCLLLEKEIENSEELKNKILDLIEDYKYSINQSTISSYSRRSDDPFIQLSRISEGALGGKARGIAFIAKILSKYITKEMFPNLTITIPRSVVLSTDVFDVFMNYHHLSNLDFYNLSDERIAAKFLEASLPATILGDLRAFIKNSRKPLILRSSGLLEDSLLQPFAGIYASMLLPNESWETDQRFQDVCNSIKYVYASTFFEKARTYVKSTPKNIGDEKMAVLIQEVVGSKHGNYFYPTISGVAKSYNYYPQGPCKPEEGIVYLALGLGKSIVDGGSSYAFCPQRPKSPLFGTPKLFMKYSQTSFYALNLKSIYSIVNYNEETTLTKLDIHDAKQHGVLDKLASTYFAKDDRLYPGIYDEGYIVIDFAPIIEYNEIPLAKALKLLLSVSEIALGYPVEIEFAVNIEKETNNAELIILQIRSMIPPDQKIDIDINKIPKEQVLFNSENALGNGIINDIYEIVYVNQEIFDMSNSNEVVSEIRKINTSLMEENKPYLLVGPGRWGSTDSWLGIPVIWSDIAGAKVIVETPYKERPIDPSQGSHFFHDMMASQVGYIITKKETDIDWNWIRSLKILHETKFIKHVKSSHPLQIVIDGKLGRAIIRKKPK